MPINQRPQTLLPLNTAIEIIGVKMNLRDNRLEIRKIPHDRHRQHARRNLRHAIRLAYIVGSLP